MKHCSGCGRQIAYGEPYYQQVTAWVADQKRDSVTLREDVEPWKFACRGCISRWQHGIADGQAAML